MRRHTLYDLFAHILAPVADAIRAECAPRTAARPAPLPVALPAPVPAAQPAPVPAGWDAVDTSVPAFELPDVPAWAIPEDVTPGRKHRARKPAGGKPRVMASAKRETRPAKGKGKPAPKRKAKKAAG